MRIYSSILSLVVFFVFVGNASNIYAFEPEPFEISCEDIKRIRIGRMPEPYASWQHMILCEVLLTDKGGERLRHHKMVWYKQRFSVNANNKKITTIKRVYPSYPPAIRFMEKTWEEVLDKLIIICPSKIPLFDKEVLAHEYNLFWKSTPSEIFNYLEVTLQMRWKDGKANYWYDYLW